MPTADQIKVLRDKTGLSIMLCKKALENSDGDEVGAVKWLKEQGVEVAEKKSGRATEAGLAEAYVHNNGQVGVLLEIKSETDFVAKNPAFRDLAHNIAMHIAASNPLDVSVLLGQPYIKNLDVTILDYINESVQKFGEKIEVTRFKRYAL